MIKKCLLLACIAVISIGGCNGGGSGRSDIPPGLNLLESDCPGEDIVAVPITDGYVWECVNTETGEAGIAGNLSGLSKAGCFETLSKIDAFCGIEVLGKASFAASHHEFDANLPPPFEDGCNPDIAISIEEVECHTILLCPGGC
jgi:hypothetical protein